MQVFKLVLPGEPDRILAFDSLPKDLVQGIRRAPVEGLPRYWRKWFESTAAHDFKKEPKPFHMLDYVYVNQDREKWGKITEYARKMSPETFRLMDKLEDMGKPLAVNSHAEVSLEPDDVVVIPLKKVLPPVHKTKEKVA